MKNTYHAPELVVMDFNTEDIITTSTGLGSQSDDLGSIPGLY